MLRLLLILAGLCLVANATAQVNTGPRGDLPALRVDLHAHLSMKPALGWLFRGSFDAPLQADSWDDKLSSKANEETLRASGVGVMVVALYAHPVFAKDMRAAVRAQINEVERFVGRHPEWAIARRASQAEAMLRSGKRVIVFSLEGAAGVLESEADFDEFISRRGIAIVTPLHLVDDRFGGAALLGGAQRVANPLALVDGRERHHVVTHYEDGVSRNRRGLTAMGKRLLVELVRRGAWIDLTHASDAALAQMRPIVEAAGQPLLFTHTSPRRFRKVERALSDEMLEAVARSGGMIGLLPSEDAMPHAEPSQRYCDARCTPDQCRGSVAGLAEVYRYLVDFLPPAAVALGTDFNGGMRHLRPSCRTETAIDEDPGFYHLGQSAVLWRSLKRAGAPIPPAAHTLEHFVRAWAKVKPVELTQLDRSLPLLPLRADSEGPGIAMSVRLGAGTLGEQLAPGLLVGVDMRVLKDVETRALREPYVYLADTRLEWLTIPNAAVAPWFQAAFAPVGIAADDGVVRLDGQLGASRVLRDTSLQRNWDLQAVALRGHARAVPGLLRSPNGHHVFFDFELGALGYRGLWSVQGVRASHGFHLGDVRLRGGVTLSPHHAHPVHLYGSASAGVALFGAGGAFRYASERALGLGVGIGLGALGAELRLDGRWLGWRAPASEVDQRRDELRATVVLPIGPTRR